MIASLSGTVLSLGLDHVVLDCHGVGYRVEATPVTLGQLRRGEQASLLTYLAVKEDSMTLYGFGSSQDREMFHLLQTVSGLGPRLAMASLAVMNAEEIAHAIANQDTKALQRIPGVGKRVAERLALELKAKVDPYLSTRSAGESTCVSSGTNSLSQEVLTQVTEALLGLGFKETVAREVAEKQLSENPDLGTSALLRAVLSELGKK